MLVRHVGVYVQENTKQCPLNMYDVHKQLYFSRAKKNLVDGINLKKKENRKLWNNKRIIQKELTWVR